MILNNLKYYYYLLLIEGCELITPLFMLFRIVHEQTKTTAGSWQIFIYN